MKDKLKLIFLILSVFNFHACDSETQGTDESDGKISFGMINVEVTEQLGLTEDKMKKVRFFIFNNNNSVPTLELNEQYDIIKPIPGTNEISKFKVILKVEMLSGKENNKIVVAIINEPSTLTSTLDDVSDYNQLMDIELDFNDFLNDSHSSLQNDKAMPMCGVIWTNRVYATEALAESNPLSMSLWRAPARVEVYLRKEDGMDFMLGSGTNIVLKNTYYKEYLVRYQNESNSLGQVHTITSGFLEKTWKLEDTDNKEIPTVSANDDGRLICSFYTPERLYSFGNDADKLTLDVNIVTNEGTPRDVRIVIDHNLPEVTKNLIPRNTIFQVVATVGTGNITAIIKDWNNQDIDTEL